MAQWDDDWDDNIEELTGDAGTNDAEKTEAAAESAAAVRPAKHRKRRLALLIAAVCIVCNTVAGTIAYVEHKTAPVMNSFSATEANVPVVVEDFAEGDTVKENVRIKLEDGEKSSFIRAAIVISLQDDDGNTAAVVPVEGVDYSITMGSGWTQNGGYWYYDKALAAGKETTDLIESVTTLNSEYHLVVDILAQTIQSNPTSAAQSEWGYVPS